MTIVVEVLDSAVEVRIAQSSEQVESVDNSLMFVSPSDACQVAGDVIDISATVENVEAKVEQPTYNFATHGLGQIADVFADLAGRAAQDATAAGTARDDAQAAATASINALDTYSTLLTSYQLSVDGSIDALTDNIVDVSSDLSALSDVVTTVIEDLNTEVTRVNGISTSLASLSLSYTTLGNELTALSNFTTQLDASYSDFSSSVSIELTAISTEVGSYSTRIEAVETQSASATDAVTALSTQVSSQATSISNLQTSLGEESNRVDTALSKISDVETSLGDGVTSGVAYDVTQLKSTVGDGSSGLVQSVNAITTSVSDQGTAISAMNTVELDVNGYVTGYKQQNNGSVGSFSIYADTFNILNPVTKAIMLQYNTGAASLDVVGTLRLLNDVIGYANFNDKPTSLSAINGTEGSKLNGIEAGATVGATAADQAEWEAYADAVAIAEADLIEAQANAYADGIVTAEETRAINEAKQVLYKARQAAFAAGTQLYLFSGPENSWPTSTNYAGGDKYTFVSPRATPAILRLRLRDAESGATWGINSVSSGESLHYNQEDGIGGYPDNTLLDFYRTVDLVAGVNEISVWATSTDGGSVAELEVRTTGAVGVQDGATVGADWDTSVNNKPADSAILNSEQLYNDILGSKPPIDADNTVSKLNTVLDVSGTIRGINIEANSFTTTVPGYSFLETNIDSDIDITDTVELISSTSSWQSYQYGSGLFANIVAEKTAHSTYTANLDSSFYYGAIIHDLNYGLNYAEGAIEEASWQLDRPIRVKPKDLGVLPGSFSSPYYDSYIMKLHGDNFDATGLALAPDFDGLKVVLGGMSGVVTSSGINILNSNGGNATHGMRIQASGGATNYGLTVTASTNAHDLALRAYGHAYISKNLEVNGDLTVNGNIVGIDPFYASRVQTTNIYSANDNLNTINFDSVTCKGNAESYIKITGEISVTRDLSENSTGYFTTLDFYYFLYDSNNVQVGTGLLFDIKSYFPNTSSTAKRTRVLNFAQTIDTTGAAYIRVRYRFDANCDSIQGMDYEEDFTIEMR